MSIIEAFLEVIITEQVDIYTSLSRATTQLPEMICMAEPIDIWTNVLQNME